MVSERDQQRSVFQGLKQAKKTSFGDYLSNSWDINKNECKKTQ